MLFKREKDISLYPGSTSGKRKPNLVLNSIAFTQVFQTVLIVWGTDPKSTVLQADRSFQQEFGPVGNCITGPSYSAE